jgi:hypothetical protein
MPFKSPKAGADNRGEDTASPTKANRS